MPQRFLDAWHAADAWTTTHSIWTVVFGSIFSLVMVLLTARVIANIAAKLVIRRVFGATRVQLPAESARQAASAQAEAASVIAQLALYRQEEIQRMHTTMEAEVSAMLEAVRDGTVPLTIAVSTPEEQQILAALLARNTPRVVVRPRRIRVDGVPQPQNEDVPTAWDRLLTEDDEEGTPCPTPTTETPPAPTHASMAHLPVKSAKKTPKPRAPKNKKG